MSGNIFLENILITILLLCCVCFSMESQWYSATDRHIPLP